MSLAGEMAGQVRGEAEGLPLGHVAVAIEQLRQARDGLNALLDTESTNTAPLRSAIGSLDRGKIHAEAAAAALTTAADGLRAYLVAIGFSGGGPASGAGPASLEPSIRPPLPHQDDSESELTSEQRGGDKSNEEEVSEVDFDGLLADWTEDEAGRERIADGFETRVRGLQEAFNTRGIERNDDTDYMINLIAGSMVTIDEIANPEERRSSQRNLLIGLVASDAPPKMVEALIDYWQAEPLTARERETAQANKPRIDDITDKVNLIALELDSLVEQAGIPDGQMTEEVVQFLSTITAACYTIRHRAEGDAERIRENVIAEADSMINRNNMPQALHGIVRAMLS
jgi:hypothetical protein